MSDLEQTNRDLKAEAGTILNGLGLLDVLGRYGEPVVSGSYVLDTMTWRDLDMYLKCDPVSEIPHFSLGGEIALRLRPERMSFRNEIVARTPGLPIGLYWGVYTSYELPAQWKIDIWCVDPSQLENLLTFTQNLLAKLTPEDRRTILAIKGHFHTHPEYRRRFTSLDIYGAVLDRGIESVEGFSTLLREMGIAEWTG